MRSPSASILAERDAIKKPLVLRLVVDTRTDAYRIEMRPIDVPAFQTLGQGKIAPDQSTRFLRVDVSGDFASPNELVTIDRLELSGNYTSRSQK